MLENGESALLLRMPRIFIRKVCSRAHPGSAKYYLQMQVPGILTEVLHIYPFLGKNLQVLLFMIIKQEGKNFYLAVFSVSSIEWTLD